MQKKYYQMGGNIQEVSEELGVPENIVKGRIRKEEPIYSPGKFQSNKSLMYMSAEDTLNCGSGFYVPITGNWMREGDEYIGIEELSWESGVTSQQQ